jgi:hypothetical protein
MNCPNASADRNGRSAAQRNAGIRLLRRGETHDRLVRTLAKRSARGFQDSGIFFKLVRALSATLRCIRARDASVREQRTPAR